MPTFLSERNCPDMTWTEHCAAITPSTCKICHITVTIITTGTIIIITSIINHDNIITTDQNTSSLTGVSENGSNCLSSLRMKSGFRR